MHSSVTQGSFHLVCRMILIPNSNYTIKWKACRLVMKFKVQNCNLWLKMVFLVTLTHNSLSFQIETCYVKFKGIQVVSKNVFENSTNSSSTFLFPVLIQEHFKNSVHILPNPLTFRDLYEPWVLSAGFNQVAQDPYGGNYSVRYCSFIPLSCVIMI